LLDLLEMQIVSLVGGFQSALSCLLGFYSSLMEFAIVTNLSWVSPLVVRM
jgi:hypothetical protein